MNRICLIEDAVDLQKIVQLNLGSWYQFLVTGTLKEASELLKKEKVDLILLDVNLPDGTGFEFCAHLKNNPVTKDIPVIFLTGKSEAVDQVMGFSLGADDYVTKPFSTLELKARIEARMRKSQMKLVTDDTKVIGPFVFDRSKQRVSAIKGDKKTDLNFTAFEYRLFFFLASHEGEIFNRTKLLQSILDANVHVNDETIYTHISSLRKKLGEHSAVLECIPRVGYCFKAELTHAA